MIESMIRGGMADSGDNGLTAVLKRGGSSVGLARKRLMSQDGKGTPCRKRKKCQPPWRKEPRRSRKPKSKCKSKKRIRTKPEAPFNSTQFIMGEHDNLNEGDLSSSRPRRHRDSSLSMESEDLEEECNTSSEDEKEFMTKQFWSAYEEFHAERLDSMTKAQLVQEYFALEEQLTLLERELKAAREQDRRRIREPSPVEDEEEDDDDAHPGEVAVDAETAAKIEIFRNEIQKVEEENERLRQENTFLRRKRSCRCGSNSSSSSSSSSDSSSSDSESDSSDSDDVTTSSGSSSPLGRKDISCAELEISGGPVSKGGGDAGPDSGIASCSEGVNSSSSGEDARGEEEPGLPQKGRPEGLLSPRQTEPTPLLEAVSRPTNPD